MRNQRIASHVCRVSKAGSMSDFQAQFTIILDSPSNEMSLDQRNLIANRSPSIVEDIELCFIIVFYQSVLRTSKDKIESPK